MTQQPVPPSLPLGRADAAEDEVGPLEATREVDGEDVLDPDLDDDRVNSAEADAIASGADSRD